jgi:ribosomal protein uS17
MARPRKKTEEEQPVDDSTPGVEATDAEAPEAEDKPKPKRAPARKKAEPKPKAEEAPADEAPADEPVAEEAPAEEAAPEAPADEPVAEPVAEDAPAEEPVAEEPPAEEPPAEEAPAEEPVAEEKPAADEPHAEESVAEEAPAEEPVAEAPAAEGEDEPAAEAPAPMVPSKPKKKRLPRSQRRQRTKPKRERPANRAAIVRLPKPEHARGTRKERRGIVVSSAMDKTIVVRVDTLKPHPVYKKIVRHSRKFHAHDETNVAKAGDVVRIVETRPLSKTKSWRLAEVLEEAK